MLVGDIYDLNSFKRLKESGNAKGFQDAEAGVVLARNLTAIDPTLFEVRYPELALLNSGIEVNNSGGWASRIQSLRVRGEGGFSDAGDSSTNKGIISLSAEDSVMKVYPREASSTWSDDEIKTSQLQNINLIEEYLTTHSKIYSQEIDKIGLVGRDGTTTGLLNHNEFQADLASKQFSAMSPTEMYDTIASVITNQRDAVNNTPEYSCDVVILPTSVMNKVNSSILNTAAGSNTVLKALKDNFSDVKFMNSFRANDVDGGGKVIAAFSTHRQAMVLRIPLKLTIGEIIKKSSFKYEVESKYRIAGLDVLEPSAGRLLKGI